MTLEERWHIQLEALRSQGRYRTLNGPRGIDFSSNDYLGYGKIFWAGAANLSRSGQASRLLRGHHEIWDEVETRLAEWHGAEAALMMTSGYAANEGLLSTVIEPQDWVASDELNHASIIDGLRLSKVERFVYRHNDDKELWNGASCAMEDPATDRRFFLVTEAYFGMDADSCWNMPSLGHFERAGLHAIIDEAHSTGCFGPTGSGFMNANGWRKISPPLVTSVHTGGKALGVPGAYICCSRLLKDLLINQCRHFIFTTAMAPVLGRWWLDALDKVQSDQTARDRLHENAEFFRGELRRHGIESKGRYYIVPIVVGNDTAAVRAAEALQKQGFDVRAIRPPTVPAGTARLRISIHADHERKDLTSLAEAIAVACS
jgi:8-amino-7-oxononanoate synthase